MKNDEFKSLIREEKYTLILHNGNENITSNERGISSLTELYLKKRKYSGFKAYDKIVGKAAAFIYVLLEVEEVFACVISKSALSILEQYGIKTEYDVCTDSIINRTKTDICPMEKAVIDINDPHTAVIKLIDKTRLLSKEA